MSTAECDLAAWQEDLIAYALTGDQAACERLLPQLAQGPVEGTAALGIHADSVHYALRQALAQRLPTVVHVVGESAFATLAREFARAYPPTQSQLSVWGEAFPEFIAGPAGHGYPLWLADLADFDLAIDRVAWTDPAQESVSLPVADGLRLVPAAGLSVFQASFPVDEIREAVATALEGDRGTYDALTETPESVSLVLWCAADARVKSCRVSAPTAAFLGALTGSSEEGAVPPQETALAAVLEADESIRPGSQEEAITHLVRELASLHAVRLVID